VVSAHIWPSASHNNSLANALAVAHNLRVMISGMAWSGCHGRVAYVKPVFPFSWSSGYRLGMVTKPA